MKPDYGKLIIDGVVFLISFGIGVFGLIRAISEFAKEKSIGKTALKKLEDAYDNIKKEFEELKREHADLSEDIASIQAKYERLIEKILNNFPFNK